VKTESWRCAHVIEGIVPETVGQSRHLCTTRSQRYLTWASRHSPTFVPWLQHNVESSEVKISFIHHHLWSLFMPKPQLWMG